MAVHDDVITARRYGVVRCGVSSLASPTLPALAREFGLRDDPASYREIDESAARRLLQLILHRAMAYNAEIMPAERAAQLADQFLGQFGRGAQFFTNGDFHEPLRRVSESVWSGASWHPVTNATFDTGVLVIGPQCSGCLWIEDED